MKLLHLQKKHAQEMLSFQFSPHFSLKKNISCLCSHDPEFESFQGFLYWVRVC